MINPIYEKLPDFAKRMVDEEKDLCAKIERLDKFLLSDDEKDLCAKAGYAHYHLMVAQLETMQAYRRILHIRIHIELEKVKGDEK